MDPHLLLDALKLVVSGYLVLVALTAGLGVHRPVLAYPFRAGYSTLRLIVLFGTGYRVKLVPLSRRAKRSTQRRVRNWRFEMQEWKDRRAEERGEPLRQRSSWASGASAARTGAAPSSTAAKPVPAPPVAPVAPSVAPVHTPPAGTSSPFPAAYFEDDEDEDDEDELPPTPFFGR